MYDKESVEKLGYIVAKVEEIQKDLKEAIASNDEKFKSFNNRVTAIENDHKKWNVTYLIVKGFVIFCIGVLAIEWSNVGKSLRRLMGWE